MSVSIEDRKAAPSPLINHIRPKRLHPIQVIAESRFRQGASHTQVAAIPLLDRVVIAPTHKHPAIFIQQASSDHRPPPIPLRCEL